MPTDGPVPNRGERVILQTLEESGPITVPELADSLASHPATIERRCRKLQRVGYVRQCTGGKFAVDESRWNARAAGD
ncbi:hypothetical protein CV102_08135 [Natronococcus pandeyae]|uniref:HTH marR-type domain-containing protein n=1 Tax=Natronococcus pandeyae TaxID=2055836 RepID=A0A8J8Q5G5_9EURY|nr:MarR family transcriptional regulator [Natronococcus pandeyae]TYL39407.1 hypothetical protein CV102_08135 [Natronococcus pandeyae]